jgi:hypothetical protein
VGSLFKMRFFCLLLIAAFAAGGISATGPDAVSPVEKYRSSKNAFDKKDALKAIGDSHMNKPAGARSAAQASSAPQPQTTLSSEETAVFDEALADRKPSIVSEAVRQIGILGLQSYNRKMIDLYDAAIEKFGGYAMGVQSAILVSLSQTKGAEARDKLRALLQAGQVTPQTPSILDAVENMGDAALLPDLTALRGRLESLLQARIASAKDPIQYSKLYTCVEQARKVELALTALKGGN